MQLPRLQPPAAPPGPGQALGRPAVRPHSARGRQAACRMEPASPFSRGSGSTAPRQCPGRGASPDRWTRGKGPARPRAPGDERARRFTRAHGAGGVGACASRGRAPPSPSPSLSPQPPPHPSSRRAPSLVTSAAGVAPGLAGRPGPSRPQQPQPRPGVAPGRQDPHSLETRLGPPEGAADAEPADSARASRDEEAPASLPPTQDFRVPVLDQRPVQPVPPRVLLGTSEPPCPREQPSLWAPHCWPHARLPQKPRVGQAPACRLGKALGRRSPECHKSDEDIAVEGKNVTCLLPGGEPTF